MIAFIILLETASLMYSAICWLILADAVPLAVAADFRAFAGGDDVLLDVLGEFGKWKGLAFCQAALGKYGVVIALYFFSCLAESLTVVGTGRADFVCVYGETDVCAFCKKLQHFLHMGCKSIAVAVSDKKRQAHPVMRANGICLTILITVMVQACVLFWTVQMPERFLQGQE